MKDLFQALRTCNTEIADITVQEWKKRIEKTLQPKTNDRENEDTLSTVAIPLSTYPTNMFLCFLLLTKVRYQFKQPPSGVIYPFEKAKQAIKESVNTEWPIMSKDLLLSYARTISGSISK